MNGTALHTHNGHGHLELEAIPRDDASEEALLSALFLSDQHCAEAFRLVTELDFFSRGNQHVFRALRSVFEETSTTDITLIRNALVEAGHLHLIGRSETAESGVARLAELAGVGATASNAALYARAVAEAAARRRIDQLGDRFKQRARERDGTDLPTVLSELEAEFRGTVESASIVEAKPTFNKITAAELASGTFDLNYLIDGILVEGQPCGLLGAQKTLKTSILLDMAVAIDQGGYFLGRFKVPSPRRVAVFSAESGWATIQETCQRICRAANRDLAETGLLFSDTLPKLGDPANMLELEKFLRGEGTQVAFFDPLYLMLMTGGDEGSIFAMGSLLRSIGELCHSLGITPVLAHHTRKNGGPTRDAFGPGELSDASWAGTAEFLRQWIMINRREKYEPGSGMHRLWFSVGGSAGHSGLWGVDVNEGVRQEGCERFWEVELHAPDELADAKVDGRAKAAEDRHREKLDAAKSRCLKALAKFPFGETKNVIRDRVGISGTVVNSVFAALLDDGAIVSCEVAKPGRSSTVEGFKINNSMSV